MGVIDELLELEHAGWRSLCEGTGGAFYGSVMTDDAVMVLAHGVAMDRDAVVASLDEAPPWSGYAITEERVIAVGEAARALVYRGRAWREGGGAAFVALMSSVYTRAGDGWRLALYQQTPVPSPV
ncbi:nuclear transport factor 2 family protein [Glycomyces arizonensis]|uniref:nuclear transport factor 2 family protein n=1 Tax=Glycomyces arizonensis TaxID=256035 RepID=UPI00047B4D1D|nr:nuclear transport factor 2 family protein [Glycomyces arizonensis]